LSSNFASIFRDVAMGGKRPNSVASAAPVNKRAVSKSAFMRASVAGR
jgi:hypothetical protein